MFKFRSSKDWLSMEKMLTRGWRWVQMWSSQYALIALITMHFLKKNLPLLPSSPFFSLSLLLSSHQPSLSFKNISNLNHFLLNPFSWKTVKVKYAKNLPSLRPFFSFASLLLNRLTLCCQLFNSCHQFLHGGISISFHTSFRSMILLFFHLSESLALG